MRTLTTSSVETSTAMMLVDDARRRRRGVEEGSNLRAEVDMFGCVQWTGEIGI